jgi:hypothetical protein
MIVLKQYPLGVIRKPPQSEGFTFSVSLGLREKDFP